MNNDLEDPANDPMQSETRKDFTISWKLLKQNYKAYLATEIFAFLAFILAGLTIYLLVFFIASLITADGLQIRPLNHGDKNIYHIILGVSSISIYLVWISFLYCQYGLAYDILSSGDMFTEFKNAFIYFKAHWWKYILLSFITGLDFLIIRANLRISMSFLKGNIVLILILFTLRYVISFSFLIAFNTALPSVTNHGSLKEAIIESIKILKVDTERVIRTFSLFYVLFLFPSYLAIVIYTLLLNYATINIPLLIIMSIIIMVLYLFKIVLGMPLLSLISTRIYNSVEFDRYKPLVIENENDEKLSKVPSLAFNEKEAIAESR